jgi:LysW-gamma-L-lysine carboxypeptidase
MGLELRLPPGLEPSALTTTALSLAKGATLEFSGEEKAFVAQRNNPLVRAFLRAIRAEGGTPRFKLKSGTSDMNLAGPAWQCPILAYGPGDSSLDHTPWEHIEVEDYLKAVKVWERVLTLLSGGGNEALD